MNSLPESFKPFFWSWDIQKLDLQKDKKLIISQLLNYGSKETTDWLFVTYTRDEIKEIAQKIPTGAWDKKSLNFWVFILGITPTSRADQIKNS